MVTLTQEHFWVGAQVPCHYRVAWCLWENQQHCWVLLSCCLGKTGRLKCCPELISCTLGVLFPCLRLWPGITVGWGWPCVSAALENGDMWGVNGNFETFFFSVDVTQIGTHKNIVQNEYFCKMGQLYRGWQVGLMLKQTPKNISSKLFLCILIMTHKCPVDQCSDLGACAWQELHVMKNRFVDIYLTSNW